jgi:hypothetical protein
MTAFRLVPLHVHGALELLVGLALMGAPFALGLSTAALVAGMAAGALVTGLALSAAIADDLDIAAHFAYDIGISVALFVAALVLAVSGDPAAAALFAVAGLGALTLNMTTMYSAKR